jgi:hypothetical protein
MADIANEKSQAIAGALTLDPCPLTPRISVDCYANAGEVVIPVLTFFADATPEASEIIDKIKS